MPCMAHSHKRPCSLTAGREPGWGLESSLTPSWFPFPGKLGQIKCLNSKEAHFISSGCKMCFSCPSAMCSTPHHPQSRHTDSHRRRGRSWSPDVPIPGPAFQKLLCVSAEAPSPQQSPQSCIYIPPTPPFLTLLHLPNMFFLESLGISMRKSDSLNLHVFVLSVNWQWNSEFNLKSHSCNFQTHPQEEAAELWESGSSSPNTFSSYNWWLQLPQMPTFCSLNINYADLKHTHKLCEARITYKTLPQVYRNCFRYAALTSALVNGALRIHRTKGSDFKNTFQKILPLISSTDNFCSPQLFPQKQLRPAVILLLGNTCRTGDLCVAHSPQPVRRRP